MCYRWGLTIDITSMNVLIISVGLCVDFCAHIVHGFLTGHGTKGDYAPYCDNHSSTVIPFQRRRCST